MGGGGGGGGANSCYFCINTWQSLNQCGVSKCDHGELLFYMILKAEPMFTQNTAGRYELRQGFQAW